MNLSNLFALTSLAACLSLAGCSGASKSESDTVANVKHDKPNVIYILVDDLGYGDIEPFGQEKIKTPNLQKMANEGMTFTQHYAGNTVCAPSRAALITGQHSGHGQIRGNYELGGYEDAEEFGQMPLVPNSPTIGKLMQKAGYETALIGKWGLGGPGSYGLPTKQGFDYFFGYLDQKQAHNHYPTHLWKNEEWFKLDNEWVHPHAPFPKGADKNDPSVYEQWKRPDFAQQRLTNEALEYVEQNKDKPFFLYLAYAAPHAALQAPDEEIAKYDFEETPYDGSTDGGYLPSLKPRATRAAMISHIDEGVGQLMAKLKKLGLDDNTLVIFTSDNGPSPEGGADLEFFESTGELRGIKRDLYEGGIRMPMVARWPEKIKQGVRNEHISAFWDVMPTLADIVGTEAPKETDGISFLPALTGEGQQQEHDNLYWEFHHWNGTHSQAVRINGVKGSDWKAIRYFNGKKGKQPKVELFDLTNDPSESTNLVAKHPEIASQALELMDNSRTRSFIDTWNFDYYKGKK
ncbi:arylsulfatase [Psychrosphaera sp. B3R10]|uniref:arylsulfatase n=1 Tax=unclassified Psychrosphaera TaxID=2641570 RepID=UPI001C096E7F|nr:MULTISPECIES: arylsulfatase [unclassified Psychrosphaera]MBU2881519.1 arylsulfatase [Psychrosphaera sp. I2R16]MBU2988696.1 arylsulfatase [Psychrosphaera sp. B3R10]MDO6721356.1 arylsulfatase [Psychrosphaera sp. 1_MG-2023]